MSFVKNKRDLINLVLLASLAVGAGYVVATEHLSAQSRPVHFSDLSDADIDMILAVKNEMHAARMQAN